MKKVITLIGLFLCLNTAFADEGMWLLTMLEKLNIEQKGCKLTPEQIYNINTSSLKDAILGLGEGDRPYGFFCTAELVSAKGLALTNYHCGFDMIQKHTSITNNYIENGFLAKNQDEELPNDGITATRMVAMYDVTDRVLSKKSDVVASPDDTSSVQYPEDFDSVFKEIVKTVTDTCSYGASVEAFFENNQYFLFVYETYKDVRLVGAPPRTIGKFGDETDNWVWPRHTGDFCVLRIYGNESGEPAEFSNGNKPVTPKHFLPISLKGYEENDYAMVMGFPGTTDRYSSANEIKYFQQNNNRVMHLVGDISLDVYKKKMSKDSLIRIKYASKYDMLSNYWKYSIGQNKGIADLNVVEEKEKQEQELLKWINEDSTRKVKYGNMLDTMSAYYYDKSLNKAWYVMLNNGLLNLVESFMFVYDCLPILDAINADDPVALKEMQVMLKDKAKKFYKDYDVNVDMSQYIALTYAAWYNMNYYIYTSKDFPLAKKYKNDVYKYAQMVFSKSIFTDENRFATFLEKPSVKKILQDPMFELMRYTLMEYFQLRMSLENPAIDSAKTLYVDATMKMYSDSLFYPDANSTLRLTYGKVCSYKPKDGVFYNYYTTLKGVFEKKDSTNREFQVPAKLEQLYLNKDYGQYTDKNNELPVCFITNNDITGGNSGSPVMNANGELIGLAFDGNWEAMSGDIIFEPAVQRTIAVDIRYVLFVIDKFADAGYLLDEMTILK